MKRLIVLLVFVASFHSLSSQVIIGWTGGYGNPQELNRVIHVYNTVNKPGLSKDMQPVKWSQGFAGGIRLGGDMFFELLYSRKRIGVHSEFDSSGVAFERQLKVLSNTWNFGFGATQDNFSLGMSIDLGRFKGLGRRGPSESIGDQEFDRLWVVDKTRLLGIAAYRLYCATTVFAEAKFGVLAVRGYVQWAWGRNQMELIDIWMLGSQLNFAEYEKDKYTNAGIMVSIQIGGK